MPKSELRQCSSVRSARRNAGLVLHEGDEGLPGDGIVEQIGRLGIVGDAAMAFEARIGAQGRAQPDVAR